MIRTPRGASGGPVSSSGSAGSLAADREECLVASIELPADSASVVSARRFVIDQLRGIELDVDVVVLMTSELVANVVEYARSPVTVAVSPGPPLRIEVADGAAASEAFRDLVASPVEAPPDAPRGRGLWLVHALASQIGLTDHGADGKTVWFEVDGPI
jgi:anti-sigma regulatory factor (Ser/Thr protein kinase)